MSVKAGTKRGRAAWEDCEDVDELKTLLNQQQTKLEKLSKENTGAICRTVAVSLSLSLSNPPSAVQKCSLQ